MEPQPQQQQLEREVAGVERGSAFLQREHLDMLTGLQLEISRLKRRCHELNCELDARFPQRTAAEECELAARRRASEGLLERQECAAAGARAELRARQVRAWALGRSLRGGERRFLEELKRRGHAVTALGRELRRQTLAAAALCGELRGARMQLYRRGQAAEEGEEEEEEEEEEGGAGGAAWRDAPLGQGEAAAEAEREEGEWEFDEEDDEEDGGGEGSDRPPSPSPGQSDELRWGRRGGGVREQRVRACVPCERVTSPQRPRPMPDPALFLAPLRYRLLRWKRPMRARGDAQGPRDQWEGPRDQWEGPRDQWEGPRDQWEDVAEDGGVRRRVDMGAAEGETAL